MGLLNYTTRANLVANTPENIADVTDCLDKIRTSVNSVAEEQLEAALATKINAIIETQIGSALATRLALGPGGRGKCVIAASEARTNTAFGTLTTPDQITGIVMPTDGLVLVGYEARSKRWLTRRARRSSSAQTKQWHRPRALRLGGDRGDRMQVLQARSPGGVLSVWACCRDACRWLHEHGLRDDGPGTRYRLYCDSRRGKHDVAIGPAFAGGFCVIEAAAGTHGRCAVPGDLGNGYGPESQALGAGDRAGSGSGAFSFDESACYSGLVGATELRGNQGTSTSLHRSCRWLRRCQHLRLTEP